MNYSKKTIKTSSGRQILIVDNFFALSQIRAFKDFVENSNYRLGTVVSTNFEHFTKSETFYKSDYSIEDVNNFGILNEIQNKFSKYLINREITVSWVYASFSNRIRLHCDANDLAYNKVPKNLADCKFLTFLFYCNLSWDSDDGGETIFCDDSAEAEIAVAYKPNRFIIFDSFIPHKAAMARPSSNDPRFSFVCGLKRNDI